ncbi:Hypothetical protein Y17_4502 [Pectobacterium wasabiae CFBP 3304]|nr:Hypothetical protein Y17_4718 [Pectobacterium wasabiae CFBP 3304]EJS92287.1 Hypothetical protein Y17_4502 [Pectobacterium wasabiae CFBP 3304]
MINITKDIISKILLKHTENGWLIKYYIGNYDEEFSLNNNYK